MNKNLVPKYAKWTVNKKLICTLCGTIVKNVTMWSMKHAKSEEHLLKIKEHKEKEKNNEVKKEEKQIDKIETAKTKQESEEENKKLKIRNILLTNLDNEEDIDNDNNFVLPSNFFDEPSNKQPSNPNKKNSLEKKENNNDNQKEKNKNKDIEINEEKEENNDNSSEIEDEVESMINCAKKVNKIISQYTKKQNKPKSKETKIMLSKKAPPHSHLSETKEELLSQILSD